MLGMCAPDPSDVLGRSRRQRERRDGNTNSLTAANIIRDSNNLLRLLTMRGITIDKCEMFDIVSAKKLF